MNIKVFESKKLEEKYYIADKIVEEKIDSFDVMQLEDMIFGIMSRELKAIVYLGAILGFIMGFINLLI